MSYVHRINYHVGEMVNCIIAQKYTSIHVNIALLTMQTVNVCMGQDKGGGTEITGQKGRTGKGTNTRTNTCEHCQRNGKY